MVFPVAPKADFPKGIQGFLALSNSLKWACRSWATQSLFFFPFNHQNLGPVHEKTILLRDILSGNLHFFQKDH